MRNIEEQDELTRSEAAYVLAQNGLHLDEQNFVNGKFGFSAWTGLGSWKDRVANCLTMYEKFLDAKGKAA